MRRRRLDTMRRTLALLIVSAMSVSAKATTFVTVTPNDDLKSIIESASNDTVINLTAGVFDLPVHAPFNQAVLIQNKSNLRITGQGPDQTILKLPSNAQFGFYTGSNVDGLTIEGLHLQGTLPLATNTHAIGNYSGTTNVHDVTFTNLRVSDTAVGISADTSTSGVFDLVAITNNEILGTVGLDPGWGYGIEISNPTNVVIADNLIEEATRHSIYVARAAVGSNILIEGNTILNHDLAGSQRSNTGRWYLAALAVTRASDVDVAFNRIVNSRTIALSVEPDEILGWPTQAINLVGNEIVDAWYVGMWAVTGQTHTALGNTITHLPNPDADANGWADEISFFNFATGTPTNSALVAPDPRWSTVDHIADLGGKVYVMNQGTLDRISSLETWAYSTSPLDWSGADSLTAQPDAGDDGQGRLHIVRDGMVFEVHPLNWSATILGDAAVSLATGGLWDHAENWSNGAVPGLGWSVTINNTAADVLATVIEDDAAVRRITLLGAVGPATLEIGVGATLSVDEGITVGTGATLRVIGTVDGDIINQGGKVIFGIPEPGTFWMVATVVAWILRRDRGTKGIRTVHPNPKVNNSCGTASAADSFDLAKDASAADEDCVRCFGTRAVRCRFLQIGPVAPSSWT